jgi:hypothetical protein
LNVPEAVETKQARFKPTIKYQYHDWKEHL